jgi:hypothetical protein
MENKMRNKYLRVVIAIAMILGIILLANSHVAWADSSSVVNSDVVLDQSEPSVLLANPGPGSVKPPPSKFYVCKDGLYSVGGVVTLNMTDLKPGYCVEAYLWNPIFQVRRIPKDAGKVLSSVLFLKIYHDNSLIYQVPAGDGNIEACYAIPPKKQTAQFYFYDFYGKRFEKRTEPPKTWDLVDTRINENKTVACGFTQTSGVYNLVGK